MSSVDDKRTCLIIGNGPSLADIPNEFLKKYTTFGSNRIYLKFTPDYYAFCDRLWIEHYIDDIKALKCKEKWIRWEFASRVPGSYAIYNNATRREFSHEPTIWLHDGATVTFILLQVAYWHGFERVGLIGVDHYYGYQDEAPQRMQTGKECAHFTTDYYDENVTWRHPNILRTTESYKIARTAYEGAGREVINITPRSHLDVFEREDWRDW